MCLIVMHFNFLETEAYTEAELTGKGHENYQIIGNEKKHFDEKEIVLETFKWMDRN